jgi:hypothetical protein
MVRDKLYACCDVIGACESIANHTVRRRKGSLLGHLFIPLKGVLSFAIGMWLGTALGFRRRFYEIPSLLVMICAACPQEPLATKAAIVTNPVFVLPILLVASLIGCGSGNPIANPNSTTGSSSTATSTPADNWQFLLKPASSDVPLANDIEAVLSLTPDKFVGTARIIGAAYPNSDPCYNIADPIPLSGTIDAQGNISVTSAAIRGQVLSFTGVLASDRSSVSLGTYTFKGGCADGQSGLLTGVKFKPIGGVYSGTLGATNSSIAVSADLTQSPTGILAASLS